MLPSAAHSQWAFQSLSQGRRGPVRVAACQFIGSYLEQPWAILLKAALRDQDVHVRRAAADALAHLARRFGAWHDPVIVEGLMMAAQDGDGGVRRAALVHLLKLPQAAAQEQALIGWTAVLKTRKPLRLLWGLQVLGEGAGPEFSPLILPFLDHPRHWIRKRAAWALGQIGGEIALQGLKQALEHPWDESLRYLVVDILNVTDDLAALPILQAAQQRQALPHGERWIRFAIARLDFLAAQAESTG